MLQVVLNKSWQQHPTKQPLTSHLANHPSQTKKTCSGLRHMDTSMGQPAKTYIHQLCTDTGWPLMTDREGWQNRVKRICALSMPWWWRSILSNDFAQMYGFKYSFLILIIYTQLYGLKQLFLFNNKQLYGFKYSYQTPIICKLLYGFK